MKSSRTHANYQIFFLSVTFTRYTFNEAFFLSPPKKKSYTICKFEIDAYENKYQFEALSKRVNILCLLFIISSTFSEND